MFHVENADFIADKLAAELLPNQEFREVLKNAIEAVERRMRADGSQDGGRIEFDVDWSFFTKTSRWYICCVDNGDGMSRSELERYTTTLAVQGAGRNQSIRGNQGMGLKISGPTRHKKGVMIRSLKNGERTSVQVGWDGAEYGLIPIGPDGEVVIPASANVFPAFVNDHGHGTVVTFLGNADDDNTFVPPGRAKGWLLKYLNTRFFRPSEKGVEVLVRVPSGDEDEWPRTAEAASERMRRRGGRSFNLTVVYGTGPIWDNASDRLGEGCRGMVSLLGNPGAGVPPADVHWWVMPTGPGIDVSSRTASGGSLAVLFQGELYEWRTGNQANPFFARLGVLFGKTRIAFVLEPKGPTIASDFARAHVLVGGVPTLESDAWLDWAEQFRAEMPERIRQAMAEEQARLQAEDPDQERRIRERLRDVMHLLRPRRFRRKPQGTVRATDEVTGADDGAGPVIDFPQVQTETRGPRTRSTGGARARGIGAILSELDDLNGQQATETTSTINLTANWVSEQQADGFTIVNGNANGLRDRAAALAGEDGRTAHILLLNREFRGYQAILAAVNEWANPEGDDDKIQKIEAVTREWVTQKMIEAVQGLRQLENGKTWITKHYDDALSPVALTAAFMADRYHTLAEVRRAAGALRQARRAAAAGEDRAP
jgi:Histidine kinase-, DNA gyrase B-, and HSP90-like ATPase